MSATTALPLPGPWGYPLVAGKRHRGGCGRNGSSVEAATARGDPSRPKGAAGDHFDAQPLSGTHAWGTPAARGSPTDEPPSS